MYLSLLCSWVWLPKKVKRFKTPSSSLSPSSKLSLPPLSHNMWQVRLCGRFEDYQPKENATLEDAYQADAVETHICLRHIDYVVRLVEPRYQMQAHDTTKRRAVRRLPPAKPPPASPQADPHANAAATPAPSPSKLAPSPKKPKLEKLDPTAPDGGPRRPDPRLPQQLPLAAPSSSSIESSAKPRFTVCVPLLGASPSLGWEPEVAARQALLAITEFVHESAAAKVLLAHPDASVLELCRAQLERGEAIGGRVELVHREPTAVPATFVVAPCNHRLDCQDVGAPTHAAPTGTAALGSAHLVELPASDPMREHLGTRWVVHARVPSVNPAMPDPEGAFDAQSIQAVRLLSLAWESALAQVGQKWSDSFPPELVD